MGESGEQGVLLCPQGLTASISFWALHPREAPALDPEEEQEEQERPRAAGVSGG